MQLNEVIDKEGIETVSQKTNISVENLRNLYDKEFEKLNRVKALGFLKIFEREYPKIEVESLREAIKEYFESHYDEKEDEVVMVTKAMENDKRGSSGLLKWLIIGGLLYAAWYFYNTGKLGDFGSKAEESESQLDDKNALKSSVSENTAESIVVKNDANGTVEIETKAMPFKQADAPLEESVEKVVLNETNATIESIDENNATKTEGADNESSELTTVEANASAQTVKDNNTTIENLTINPTRGMLWYGFINVDTKEKREFMNKVSTPFELNGGRWILVTGHGYVDIVSDAKTIELTDRVKHYFYIDSKEIREIDRKEFRGLNNGKGW